VDLDFTDAGTQILETHHDFLTFAVDFVALTNDTTRFRKASFTAVTRKS
jgi:hypothetical protein